MTILAIIPARGGSKGVPRKNIRELSGKPLIVWSIEQALACPEVNRVVVSTDCPEIAAVSKNAGAEVPALRPTYLAADNTPTELVLQHVIDEWCPQGDPDAIMLLQPTSPIRHGGTLQAAINCLWDQQADSLLSVCESHAFFWENLHSPNALYDYQNRPRRQDIAPQHRWYRENGSIYITRTEMFRSCGNRLGGKIALHVMCEDESWDIDTEVDFQVVESLMKWSNL